MFLFSWSVFYSDGFPQDDTGLLRRGIIHRMRFTIRSILVLTTATALWLTLLVHVPQVAIVLAAMAIAVGIFWAARFVRRGRWRDLVFVAGVLWSYFTSFLLAIAIWPNAPPDVVRTLYEFTLGWLQHTPAFPLIEWYFDVCRG